METLAEILGYGLTNLFRMGFWKIYFFLRYRDKAIRAQWVKAYQDGDNPPILLTFVAVAWTVFILVCLVAVLYCIIFK